MGGFSKFSSLIRTLKKTLFGIDQQSLDVASPPNIPISGEMPGSFVLSSPTQSTPPTPSARQPYFIQIGLDFGTSFSKCIYRDLMTDKAQVYLPPGSEESELPFLIPCALSFANGTIIHGNDPEIQYTDQGLYHIKQALVKVALGQLSDPLLSVYHVYGEPYNEKQFKGFVESCAIYYLAGVLGEVRKQIRNQYQDFGAHQDDYMAVNLAVPVKDAQRPLISDLYLRVLSESWNLSDQLVGHPSLHISELEQLRKKEHSINLSEACFIYPEVSANVQGFVRSRVSSDGIYLFSDVGAETVDQSVFIFRRRDGGEHLTYLHGSVLPLGSSYMERLAADYSGMTGAQSLEIWRKRKERGGEQPELIEARRWIEKELIQSSYTTLAYAKRKLFIPEQLNEIRLIFGGGGHSKNPYETAVLQPFSGNLFRYAIRPDVIGLPLPKDLEVNNTETRWMRRLYVAYGLSFEKSMLAGFTYPKDVGIPESQEIWPKFKNIQDAPSKDEC